MNTEYIETIVIGGGQAGLSVGYFLARRNKPFLILDASARIGDAWRNRYDSLRLFSPARYSGLPGLRFPARGDYFPTKDDMADYLEKYARHFQLPVRSGVTVKKLSKEGSRFVILTDETRFESDNVVVAMTDYQSPKTPEFAGALNPAITQLHSHDYRNPSQLQDGDVLVVGVGNSGADIALDAVRTHRTWLAGKETGHVPWPIDSFFGRFILVRLVRFIFHYVLSLATPVGRKQRPKILAQGGPLVRVKPKDLESAGVVRVSKVAGVKNGLPVLADGQALAVKNVIWCTGYHHTFPWIDLAVNGADGMPMHERGVARNVAGLYFVGLRFLFSMSSGTLMGVGRDAEYVVQDLARRPNAVVMKGFGSGTRDSGRGLPMTKSVAS